MKKHGTSKRLTQGRIFGRIRLKAPARLKRSTGAKKPVRFEWPMSARPTAALATGLAALLLIIALWPSTRQEASTSLAYNLPGPKTAGTAGANGSRAGTTASVRTPVARSKPRTGPDVDPRNDAAESNVDRPAGNMEQAAPVTITGCLEADDDTFRLKDTVGTDAPKARSWRSGFLKKRAASIQVVDQASRIGLPQYVGQRVAATGVLVDREMRVHSLHRVATSCG